VNVSLLQVIYQDLPFNLLVADTEPDGASDIYASSIVNMDIDSSSPHASSEMDINQPISISDDNEDSKKAKFIKEMEKKISTKFRYSLI